MSSASPTAQFHLASYAALASDVTAPDLHEMFGNVDEFLEEIELLESSIAESETTDIPEGRLAGEPLGERSRAPIDHLNPSVLALAELRTPATILPTQELPSDLTVCNLPGVYRYRPAQGIQQTHHFLQAVTEIPDPVLIPKKGMYDDRLSTLPPEYRGKWTVMYEPARFQKAQLLADATDTSREDWYLMKYTRLYPAGDDWRRLDYHFAYNRETKQVVAHYFKEESGLRYGYAKE